MHRSFDAVTRDLRDAIREYLTLLSLKDKVLMEATMVVPLKHTTCRILRFPLRSGMTSRPHWWQCKATARHALRTMKMTKQLPLGERAVAMLLARWRWHSLPMWRGH